ncbi:MAG: phenylacetate--CoA ligase family protein [Betaproteobacteria bacterium]|nr:phenylacetate--CoA ligase family protein [Betaproteobacteria bacterium]
MPELPAKPSTIASHQLAAIALDVLATNSATPRQIAERQASRWASLLQAALGTRYYRQALQGLDPANIPLTALPVTDKPAMMQRFAEHVTDPELTLEGLQSFCADPQRVGQPYLGRYWVWESSGSTGQPGLFVQDEAAMAIYDALEGLRRHSPRPWVRLLDPLYLGERLAFVGATGGHYASQVSVQRQRKAQPWLASRWRSFSILQAANALTEQLEAFGPSIVATYPTAALLLAELALRDKLHIRPAEVWTGGETLTPAVRSRIEQGLGCALRNSYGASEFLPIAWECGRGRLHVNADWVILEPVDANHRPVPNGQVSHTTLLTNLANHVQPLIRFDIGDRILIEPKACTCGSALPVLQVQGRRDDMLVVPGRDGSPVTLLPLALTTVLEDQAGLFDFQLRQLADGDWRVTLGPRAARGTALRNRYRRVLTDFALAQGATAPRIVICCVDSLPLSASGKLKRIVAVPAAGRRPGAAAR